MEAKFTKWPWATRETSTHITVVGADGEVIFHDDKRLSGVVGDARLISAAPELLEAIQLMLEHAKRERWAGVFMDKAISAIDKATGAE